jgi:cwf21 domain
VEGEYERLLRLYSILHRPKPAGADLCFSSGTNGYVVRNLSHLRSHDTAADRMALDALPFKHREPDQEILEHERKRKVEVACYELQVKLEDEEYVFIM